MTGSTQWVMKLKKITARNIVIPKGITIKTPAMILFWIKVKIGNFELFSIRLMLGSG